MNKIKTNKVTYLAAAVLATASLLTVNTNNAKADTVKSDSQTDNSQVPTNQVTENDVSSAQKKANDLQQIANDKQNTYQQMQNDNQNAMTRAQNDVNTAQNNKVVAQKTYDQAVTANVQNNQAIDTNQKATEETIVSQQHNSQDIKDNQAKIQTAQTKLNQDKQHSGKDATSIPTKSEIDQARKAVERGERETANDLTASSDYVKAVKKYDGLDQSDSMPIWVNNQSNYDKDMYQGSRATIENKANDYKHNKEDEQHQVNLDHITPDEYQEINEYAIRLINSVRSQTGRPNLILNKDVMKMAQVIADKYNEDGRSNLDGKGHDYKAVNDAARQFSLEDDPDNNSQYYEDLSGWPTNVTSFINHDKTNLDAHNWYGWYVNSDPTITHTVSMDYIKQNIYLDLAAMFFNDHEWDHAASLLSIGDMNQDNDTKHYAFGMSISVLPNTNDVSTHYLLVPDNEYVHSNNPKVTPISNQADEQVTSLAQEKANLREAQAKYQALLDASKGASKQNDQTLIADQDTLDQLQGQAQQLNIEKSALQNKLNDLINEKTVLLQRKQELANAIKDSHAKLTQAEADLQAKQEVVKHLSKSLPHTQAELDKAENDAKQAQAKANQAKEIYQKVLSAYQAEQQVKHQAKPSKPDTGNVAKPDTDKHEGNTTKPNTGNVAKPDTDKHEGNTAKSDTGNVAINEQDSATSFDSDLADLADAVTKKVTPIKTTTNTIKKVKHSVLMRKNRAFYLINGKTMLKFKSYKQVTIYLLKHKINTEVRSNTVIKLAKNARFYTKSGRRTLHLIKRGKQLHISEFVMIKGYLYAHLAHRKFYIRATRLF
ncbi:SEC10/PgrA surface exclusion domain-containing protein [Lactobacillus helveticus]|uniref:SEC10/PgrA surface exclusion domain-containing protein n=1 Tax=Lactobacillus helveticus TaxID=1587 RepID=UPI0013FD4CBD|nr:SEC10/PgrA surface exclusion domain-containing protein [Lactobacillus helveticus]NHL96147.1 SEC10/PgrA surface exclusion domain-containing protein [Lactobacillus helveticus]